MSNDKVFDDVRVYVSALADAADNAVEMPVSHRPGRPGRSRRLITITGVAAALAAAGIAWLAAAEDRDRLATGGDTPSVSSSIQDGSGTEHPDRPTPSDPRPGALVSVLPEPPLEVRGDLVMVWAGEELVVWGGDVEAANMGLPGENRVFADGAAFDPATEQWRRMSPAPLPASADTPVGVPTDDGVVIARGVSVARWHPSDDTWTELPDAPAPVHDLTWTGEGLISASANAVLPVDAARWTSLERPPIRLERPTTAWTGSDLVVVGGPSTPFTSAEAMAVDPRTRKWRTLPAPPSELHAEALAASWDGDRVVVVNYDMQAISYDPAAEAWTTLPPVPARFSEWYPVLEASQGYTVAFMSQAVAVLRPDGNWIPLPYGNLAFGPTTVAPRPAGHAGPVVYSAGLDVEAGRNVVTALNLAHVDETPAAIQVGVAAITLPAEFSIVGTGFETDSTTDAVTVELAHGQGSCVLTSTYRGQPSASAGPLDINETLPESPGVPWRRNEQGTTWITAGDSDDLMISCDAADDARLLARSTSL